MTSHKCSCIEQLQDYESGCAVLYSNGSGTVPFEIGVIPNVLARTRIPVCRTGDNLWLYLVSISVEDNRVDVVILTKSLLVYFLRLYKTGKAVCRALSLRLGYVCAQRHLG
jgi:hypothetical protein